MSLSKNINPSLVLVQPRKTRPYVTERLLMGHKESNQTNKLPKPQLLSVGDIELTLDESDHDISNYYMFLLKMGTKSLVTLADTFCDCKPITACLHESITTHVCTHKGDNILNEMFTIMACICTHYIYDFF